MVEKPSPMQAYRLPKQTFGIFSEQVNSAENGLASVEIVMQFSLYILRGIAIRADLK
jgi:hypothetical protein